MVAGRPEGERCLVVSPSSRELRRRLGPLAWAVLEDVALDAGVDDHGRLVATTSTRAVAEHLGLTPGTAARALGRLRSLGLVRYTRHDGPAGRFGLAAYVLDAVPGLEVCTGGDSAQRPCAVSPRSGEPRPVEPRAGDAPMEPSAVGGRPRRPDAVSSPDTAQLQLLGDHVDAAAGALRRDPTAGRSR